MRRTLLVPVALLVMMIFAGSAESQTKLLPIRERPAVIDRWLRDRLDTILPEIMRREGFDMWIIDNREYNEDPVFFSLMPGNTMAARRRTILAIYDPGEGMPLETMAVSRYGIGGFYSSMWNPEEEPDQYRALAALIEDKDPDKIGINVSDTFAFGDGLTASSLQNIKDALPSRYENRLEGAERLAVGWLERRTPDEMEVYEGLCELVHVLIARAFSSEVIHPGITRNEDVVWWFRDQMADMAVEPWFSPSIDIIRQGGIDRTDPDWNIIRRGDVLHCDVGIVYLGLCTDTQQMAYVLKPGETTAPAGLKQALANSNKVQDILMGNFVAGRSGNEILKVSLDECRAAGLDASIYTHPVGFHGHAAGVMIGMWDQQDGVPGTGEYFLFDDTIYAIELNCTSGVSEWNGQNVTISLEQQGVFTGGVCRFVDQRQHAYHIIR